MGFALEMTVTRVRGALPRILRCVSGEPVSSEVVCDRPRPDLSPERRRCRLTLAQERALKDNCGAGIGSLATRSHRCDPLLLFYAAFEKIVGLRSFLIGRSRRSLKLCFTASRKFCPYRDPLLGCRWESRGHRLRLDSRRKGFSESPVCSVRECQRAAVPHSVVSPV